MILDDIYQNDPNARLYDGYISTVCLFHDDTKPSLLIYPDRYYCQACGASGNTKHLLKSLQSHTIIPEKVEQEFIKNPFWNWLRKASLADTMRTGYRALRDLPSNKSYLYKRNISEETIKKVKIGYLDGFFTIPVIKNNRVIGALARAGESITNARYFMPKDQDTSVLFSPDWNMINERSLVFLTYGTFDAMSIHECNFPALSTIAGKQMNASIFQDIRKRILIFPDRGEEKEAQILASKLGWRGKTVKFYYPESCKDINDLHQIYGTNKLKQILKEQLI